MCGRFALFRWSPALAALPGFPARLESRWNIAPGQQVLLVRGGSAGREAALVHWGLTPAWLRDLSRAPAQARAETLAEQPLFREAFALRRGLLPANGFYEWRGPRRRPFWMSGGEQRPLLSLAALWEAYPVGERVYLSAAVVTVAAGAQRRPLLLDAAGEALWLDAATGREDLQALLASAPQPLRERPLAGLGNSPQEEGPQCLTPA